MEIWRSVKGFEGLYEIGNYGNVKALRKERNMPNGNTRVYDSKILKQYLNNRGKIGYKCVYFYYHGKKHIKYVHKLVALHFIDNVNNYNNVNHKDGNSHNNHFTNLEWCTTKENNIHAVENNLRPLGENIYNSKFTNKEVQIIREMYKTGKYTQSSLADLFKCGFRNIHNIVRYKTYKGV